MQMPSSWKTTLTRKGEESESYDLRKHTRRANGGPSFVLLQPIDP
jgi:hypothetical protein